MIPHRMIDQHGVCINREGLPWPAASWVSNIVVTAFVAAFVAAARFRRALALDPSHVESLCNLGGLLHGQGRAEDAERTLRLVHPLAPRPL